MSAPVGAPHPYTLTFLPLTSKMLCRDTSTNSPSSRTPRPLGMRAQGVGWFCRSSGRGRHFAGPHQSVHWARSDLYVYLRFPRPLSRSGVEQPPSLHFPQGASVPVRVPEAGALPRGVVGLQDQAEAPPAESPLTRASVFLSATWESDSCVTLLLGG